MMYNGYVGFFSATFFAVIIGAFNINILIGASLLATAMTVFDLIRNKFKFSRTLKYFIVKLHFMLFILLGLFLISIPSVYILGWVIVILVGIYFLFHVLPI